VLELAYVFCIKRLSIQAEGMKDYLYGIHKQANKMIIDKKKNAKYKALNDINCIIMVFEVRDLVW
jgi:hypothetical protein